VLENVSFLGQGMIIPGIAFGNVTFERDKEEASKDTGRDKKGRCSEKKLSWLARRNLG